MLEKLIVYGYSINMLTNSGECTIQNFLKISKKITNNVKKEICFNRIATKLLLYVILATVSFILTTVFAILDLIIIQNII